MTADERLAVARGAIAEYEAWLADPDPTKPAPLDVVARLAACTRWLIAEHEKA